MAKKKVKEVANCLPLPDVELKTLSATLAAVVALLVSIPLTDVSLEVGGLITGLVSAATVVTAYVKHRLGAVLSVVAEDLPLPDVSGSLRAVTSVALPTAVAVTAALAGAVALEPDLSIVDSVEIGTITTVLAGLTTGLVGKVSGNLKALVCKILCDC